MNEEFDPTLEIGISGQGMSEEDTQKAVQNIEAADIENGIVEPEVEVPAEVAVSYTHLTLPTRIFV